MNVLPSQFELLQGALNVASAGHRAVSQNIANVNTPGYLGRQVDFGEQLSRLMASRDAAGTAPLRTPGIQTEPTGDPQVRGDGNNVDIDREVSRLQRMSLMFQAISDLLSMRLAEMRGAIEMR